jgi:hypothetical protein
LGLLIRSGVVAITASDDGADSGQERMLPDLMAPGLMIDTESCSAKICA